jgi:outer membrane receptor protein involved in Fe transport
MIALMLAGTAWAQVAGATRDYDIPAGSLVQAVNSISQQSGVQVVYDIELLKGRTVGVLKGTLSLQQALNKALAGTGLTYQLVNDTTVVIRKASPSAGDGKADASTTGARTEDAAVRVKPTTLDTVTVTGTRIRGGTTPSPVITIGSEEIQEEGFTDLGEVIRSIPQNFSGGQNPGVVNGTATSNANQNITGGSALNLRGLGADASLTLLNGRRPAYDGFSQAVDINAIPVDAVERLEIIPDGASAIYGSDAVGGVANVILKRDFEGMTVGTRYGAATDGGLTTHEYTATGGTTWSTGGLIATWMKVSNDPVYSGQRNYTKDMYAPTTIYPGGDLHSGLLSVHQQIGDAVEFRLDALRTERESFTKAAYETTYYPYAPNTTTTLVSPSIVVSLPNDWTLSIEGAWGKGETVSDQSELITTTGVVSANYRDTYNNESRAYSAGVEGPLFVLPGGDARLAVGAGYRNNHFLNRDLINGTTYADGGDSSRFAYAELNLPLIGQYQNIAGIRRLEFTAAVRSEDYDSFGSVTTPKLGLIYGPSADFTLKASWGKSFKVPTLLQQYQSQPVYLYSAGALGGTGYAADATALWHGAGGNPDLDPERARTWGASLEFHPEALPGLQAELSWFDIDYTDRVALPFTSADQALSNPIYSDFISYSPTEEEQAAILATASAFYNYAGKTYDASNVIAIISNLYTNVARQKIKGLDLSGAYRFDLGSGRLTVLGSASWLDSSQQTTVAQSAYDLSGNLFYPAKVKGRIGVVWNQENFSGSAFTNYTDGVTDTADEKKTSSFTTFDIALRYNTGERNDALSGLTFELSAQNLFDRTPPLYTAISNSVAPYDSTNYSAIGRFVNISVSKHW